MSLENVFEIDVDIKSKTAIRTPTVTQNDTVIFIFRVFDEGRIYSIDDGSTFTMMSTRPDKQAVITVGEVTGTNIIRFKLGSTELEIKGKVEAVIQVYDADGRVSTIPFRYEVLNDPSTNYIPSDNEQTLIEQVLGDGPRILADAQQATTDAYEAAEAANTAADNANQVASDVAQAITETRQATQDAVEITEFATQAEQEREVAESERQQNEDDRILAETARMQAETSRQDAEEVRQQQEAQRQSDTQTAISNAEEATEGAQAVADNTRYIELYNSANEYKKNNVVRYGKNSYIALQDTQGNEPNASGDSAYWGLLAVGGVDGTVSSVNGKQGPNIVLTAEDVGAATPHDLQIMNDYYTSLMGKPDGIALLNSQGKPVDSDGNEVGGGSGSVNSVNNVEPDTNGNIELTASNINTSDGISIQEEMTNLKSSASSVKSGVANVVGPPLSPSDTGQQMVDKILSLKNFFISNLMDKGVYDANINNSLEELIMLIRNINSGGVAYEAGMVTNSYDFGTFEYAGTTGVYNMPYVEFPAPSFTPTLIVIKASGVTNFATQTVFDDTGDSFYHRTVKVTRFNGSIDSDMTYNFKAGIGDAIINPYSEIIRLPVFYEDTTYTYDMYGFTGI